ncbi:recombinase family protein [Citrobacter portucalensis]|uniref:recombinase family protein n=1 Tax=Citrobacter portucalensis TaxID=1639133 RepID=UPI00226BB6AD|nr:recombinase family protein [Citrobacter portucalensis]MCX9021534.1 recombinase family protein [Citrobacter portucalensis]
MSRTFAYCRVSTDEQTTDNQVIALKAAGYDIPKSRIVSEVISGGVQAMQRPQFANMVENKLESGDTLVFLKLDRVGRNNIDVQQTVNMLLSRGVRVIILDLPIPDLSKPEGQLMLQMFSAFAEFEKARIIERTNEGLNRAKAEGKKLGRPSVDVQRIQELKAEGLSQSKVAAALSIGIASVKRHWN